MATYSLVDLVVFNKQNLVPFAAESPLELFENKFLTDDHLLRCILIAICTRFALLLWIEDDGKLGRLQRTVDKLKSSICRQLLVVVDRGILHELFLLRWVRNYNNRCVAVVNGTEDLIHNGMYLGRVVQDEHYMSEDDRILSTKQSLGADQVFLASDLMWNALREGVLDMPDGGLSAVH